MLQRKARRPGRRPGEIHQRGYMAMNRAIFDRVRAEDSCDLEYGPLEQLADEGELMVYRHQGFWSCMDTLRDTEYLNKLWAESARGLEDLVAASLR